MLEIKVVSICLAEIKISTVALENCKISALKRSIEKPVLLDFESLSTIFWLGFVCENAFSFFTHPRSFRAYFPAGFSILKASLANIMDI